MRTRSNPYGRMLLLLGLVAMVPFGLATDTCREFLKQVCVTDDCGVDGDWWDADTRDAAPSADASVGTQYRFIITNCEATKRCHSGMRRSTLLPTNPAA